MVRDERTINVMERVTRRRNRELDAEEWKAFWADAGLGPTPWGAPKRKSRRGGRSAAEPTDS
jgi:hypothetical protein